MGGHGFRTETLRIRRRICEWGLKNSAYRVIVSHSEKTKIRGITKLSRLKIGVFRGNQSLNLEQGEPVVNVHTERKIKRKRRAGGQ